MNTKRKEFPQDHQIEGFPAQHVSQQMISYNGFIWIVPFYTAHDSGQVWFGLYFSAH